jgi:hypothetical protein
MGTIGKPDETIVALASAELTPPSQLSNLHSWRKRLTDNPWSVAFTPLQRHQPRAR